MHDRTAATERWSNVGLGLLRAGMDVTTQNLLGSLYVAAAAHARPLRLSVAMVLVAFVAYDLLYYFAHRAQHRIGVLWAIHAVHHQATHFDVTVGFRVGILNGLVLFPFFLPLAMLGVPFPAYLGISLSHAVLMT